MNEDVKANDEKMYETFSITMELERPLLVDEDIDENIEKSAPKKQNKNPIYKKILLGVSSLFIVVIIGFFVWANTSYEPKEMAKQALISDESVDVNISDYISFTPKGITPTKGLILYPGAKVEPEAYAPLAKDIAKEGYEVIIADMTLNFAILSANEASKIIKDYDNIESWSIGGHSLGGVAAAKFASYNKYIDGVVLLASYPTNDELKKLGKEVISIWGSSDGVLNFESLYKSKEVLPLDTTYIDIEGGNHAQFGDYGKQKGDNDALISQEEQLKITSDSITQFLDKLN